MKNQSIPKFLFIALAFFSFFIFSFESFRPNNEPGGKTDNSCLDQSDHKVSFITVESGVDLEVLDWGGTGDYLVFITGLGDNAHVFDNFAYQFTDINHVIGITRRGFGKSSKPLTGYDASRRALDYIKVLDNLGISSAVFAGHSISGEELSELGVNYPDRVKKLIYLDALDFGTHKSLAQPPMIEYTETDLASVDLFISATVRYFGFREPNAAVCNGFVIDNDGKILDAVSPSYVTEQIKKSGVDAQYNKISAPALGIFDVWSEGARLPFYPLLDNQKKQEYDAAMIRLQEWHVNAIKRWSEIKNSRLIELHDANHYIFITRESEVATGMRKFLKE